ncbi:peroxisomal targeting signal 2 receptor [Tulasnella sp. 418]|nr:peroxisomal targeting signal 2 receptor [Tulasnella sp. 418]
MQVVPQTVLKTPGFSHWGVAWSPFHPGRIALASSANYGLVGNGRLHLAGVHNGHISLDTQYDTQDGLYDLAWSEIHENQLVTCSGDGSIKLWDLTINFESSAVTDAGQALELPDPSMERTFT